MSDTFIEVTLEFEAHYDLLSKQHAVMRTFLALIAEYPQRAFDHIKGAGDLWKTIPELGIIEAAMASDSRWSYMYAEALGRRFHIGEKEIAKYAGLAYYYTLNVIRTKRFLMAEPTIVKHPIYAYLYASDIIKGRWPEAEPTIKTVPDLYKQYCKIAK